MAIYSLNLASLELATAHAGAAEPLLRDGLRIRAQAPGVVPSRRRTLPEDDWSVGAARSLLGASLAALRRYTEAASELEQARRELQAAPTAVPDDLAVTARRLESLGLAARKAPLAAKPRS